MKFNLCIVGRDMNRVKGEEKEKKKSHRKIKKRYTTGYQTFRFKITRKKKQKL